MIKSDIKFVLKDIIDDGSSVTANGIADILNYRYDWTTAQGVKYTNDDRIRALHLPSGLLIEYSYVGDFSDKLTFVGDFSDKLTFKRKLESIKYIDHGTI